MTEAAAPVAAAPSAAAATASPAPNAANTGADGKAAEATTEEAAPDPEAELEAHVQHALKTGKRKEAAKKAAEAKAEAKAKKPEPPAPAKGKADPEKPAAEKADAKPDTDATESEPEKPEPRRGLSPRQKLEQGDIEGAFLDAFGKKPGDFQINSARWEQYRKKQQADKAKMQQEFSAREQQLNGVITRAQREARELIPLREAKQLFDAGDYEGALKHAFGASFDDFQRGLLKQYHGRNPEVDALRAEMERDRQERIRERQEYEQQLQQQQLERQQQQFVESMTSTIAGSDDPQLSALSRKPAFIRRVYALMQEHYDQATNTTLPVLEAADMARQELVDHYGDVFGSRDAGAPAVSVRGGSNLAKPAAQATKTISQHGAAETSAPPRGDHGKSLEEQVRETLQQYGIAN